jgi:hypothetical protein
MVNVASEKYSYEEMLQRAFLRVSWNVHHMWQETGSSDTRLFLEPLIPNKFVIVGQSKKGGTYKEHVVPRILICTQCHSMFENGESIETVAEFIRKFLKIVLITKEEQELLDRGKNLNLRQEMPDGWTFQHGCEFERLKVAGIEFDLFSTNA